MSRAMFQVKTRLIAPALLAAVLAACSGQESSEPAATASPAPARPARAAAPAPATAQARADAAAATVATTMQAMNADQLREAALQALKENRMYAPAGNNAVEYYLALRDKLPNDASVNNALTDWQPYTVIAAEQSLTRENFTEARRLVALIQKVNPSAPALPRLQRGIDEGIQAASRRAQAETDRIRRADEDRATRQLAEQQAAEAARQEAARQEAARLEAQRLEEAQRQEAQRQEAQRLEAERRAAAERAAAAAVPPPAPTLRAISTPAPNYPAAALRSGLSGDVLVEFTVGTNGAVTSADVVQANPPRVFNQEAINAVKRWRFEPVSSPVTLRRKLVFQPGN